MNARRPVDRVEVAAATRRHLNRGRAQLAALTGGLTEVASEGAWVWDSDGRRYLDCGGYGVFLLGHRHPAVVEAVVKQIQTHPLATRLMLEPVAARAAEALIDFAPAGLDYAHFVNSGTEATEAAIKLARANGYRHLVSTTNGYHGKTMGALSITARDFYQAPFRPLLPDVSEVAYGDAGALGALLAATPKACVFVEPVQGEGGVVIPPAGYLAEVADLCKHHGALLVVDEIQTGLGRLGARWGCDLEGVSPDILLVGKTLSGGVIPAAAMLARADIYEPFNRDPFLHTSTFAASPVAMAAAEAAVRAIENEGLVERARELGVRLAAGLVESFAHVSPRLVAEVRGAGLLLGIEMANAELAGELVLECLERGLIVNHSLNANHVVRLTPPAILDDTQVGQIFDILAAAAAALARHHPV
jgi:putrescine aminotransferase